MLYKQKKSQTKPVIMLSRFVGVYDDAHRKDDSKSVPAIADSYNKHMGGLVCLSRWKKVITVDKRSNF